MIIIFLSCIILPYLVNCQTNCNEAPSEALRTVCLQLNEWDNSARIQPVSSPTGAAPPGVAGFVAVQSVLPSTIVDVTQCNDIPCICGLAGGILNGSSCRLRSGLIYSKGIRKEYRMMNNDERERFHSAMWTLKRNGDYDRLAHIHANVQQSPSAHSGPAFLPWHREYVKRFEITLRLVDPSITVPYWDTTLDGALSDPKYSVLWSNELMGETSRGQVTTGAFRGWTNMNRVTFNRSLGTGSSRVLNYNDLNLIMTKTRIESILAFTSIRNGCPYSIEWDNIEFAHGYSHVYVGGEMLLQHTAAFDPLFFLYHSYIDSLWEEWRTRRQSRTVRETAYPPNNGLCSSQAHFSTSSMLPFSPLQNIDGCSNDYTDNLYSYDTRKPSCSLGDNCGSKYLFCDRSHGTPVCSSKIRLGQPCNGYNRGENMCYNSICLRGICSTPQTVAPTTTTTTPRPTTTAAPAFESCYNEHECCGPWQSRGECTSNPGYMRTWCGASCGVCTPRLYNLQIECSDRHPSCRSWSSGGECTSNPLWMNENCRQSCNRCTSTRELTCFPPNTAITTQAPTRPTIRNPFFTRRPFQTLPPFTPTPPTPIPSTTIPWWITQRTTTTTVSPDCTYGCTDSYICCSYWARNGYCTRASAYMQCNCPVACNFCTPSYRDGTCANYALDCVQRSNRCSSDHWTTQNCRSTCRSCLNDSALANYCERGNQRRRPQQLPPNNSINTRRSQSRRAFNRRVQLPLADDHHRRNVSLSRTSNTKKRGEGWA